MMPPTFSFCSLCTRSNFRSWSVISGSVDVIVLVHSMHTTAVLPPHPRYHTTAVLPPHPRYRTTAVLPPDPRYRTTAVLPPDLK
jgi:hypothetical protein